MIIRFIAMLFSLACIGGIFASAGVAFLFWFYGNDLPDLDKVSRYEPAVISRAFDGRGETIAEFYRERRLFTPIDEIPPLVKNAFISAEDKNFYHHFGFDPLGIVKAAGSYALFGGRLRGASTITQQVMKNFLLDGTRSAERKIKEILLAVKAEQVLSKDQILELYLNEIYLGARSYGVAAAAANYFGKTLEELTPAEAAYLAALPKAPSTTHPVRDREKAISRRNYVIGEMVDNGYLTPEQGAHARKQPLDTVLDGKLQPKLAEVVPMDYFSSEVRRQLVQLYGDEKVFGGGLNVSTTIDRNMQTIASNALKEALEKFDRDRDGYRGPMDRLDPELLLDEADWRDALSKVKAPRDIPDWHKAVVLQVGVKSVRIGIDGVPDDADGHYIPMRDLDWARPALPDGKRGPKPSKPADIFEVGDVVFVKAVMDEEEPEKFDRWSLRQIPRVEGGLMAMDPHTGRVLAMQGGFSYQSSNFNRATQANRQPGSAFKPFVYAAALDSGYSPSTIILDAPVTIESGGKIWRPKNYAGRFYGPSPMRVGIEQSRNVMTVRLAQDLGMAPIVDYAERFGLYDDMPPYLSYALGAGDTTLYRLTAAYAMFANGGIEVEPTLIDRVQDRRGKTLFRHDHRICHGCDGPWAPGQVAPWAEDTAPRIMDAVTAYQLTAMMKGVIQRGTGRRLKDIGFPLAGKSGTTNEERSVWFMAYTPDIVVGCYMGYDNSRPLGRGTGGATNCAPIVGKFLTQALADKPHRDFTPPKTAVLVKVDHGTGVRLEDDAEGPNVVTEAFRPWNVPKIGAYTGKILGDNDVLGVNFDLGAEVDLPMTSPDGDALVEGGVIDGTANDGSVIGGGENSANGAANDNRPNIPVAPTGDLGGGGIY